MPRTSERTEYCRQQALECAAAAAATTIANIREAYLNLEQGWVGLAPDIADSPTNIAANPAPPTRDKPTSVSRGAAQAS
jgi:hypothetical protein